MSAFNVKSYKSNQYMIDYQQFPKYYNFHPYKHISHTRYNEYKPKTINRKLEIEFILHKIKHLGLVHLSK